MNIRGIPPPPSYFVHNFPVFSGLRDVIPDRKFRMPQIASLQAWIAVETLRNDTFSGSF
jgi:hypothetical protein